MTLQISRVMILGYYGRWAVIEGQKRAFLGVCGIAQSQSVVTVPSTPGGEGKIKLHCFFSGRE
ncbi:MAG: hypothetical protein WAO21_02120 [Verrucomicrobiia bacterium]